MKSSLQKIQDSYEAKGYKGEKLRKALEKDREYQEILKQRKRKLKNTFSLTNKEEETFVMSTDKDYEILGKIKQLEKTKLTKQDKELVKFLKSQLLYEWRKPLLKFLDKLLKKYNQ